MDAVLPVTFGASHPPKRLDRASRPPNKTTNILEIGEKRHLQFVYHHRTQGRGGEGVHISSVVNALTALGHTIRVVSPPGVNPMESAGDAPVDKSDKPVSGVQKIWKAVSRNSPQIIFELLELGYNLFALRHLRRVLKAGHVDILYERYAFFLFAGVWLARRTGIKVVLEVNEVAGIERARGLFLKRFARRIERYVFSHADAVITVSSFLANEAAARGARDGTVHLTPNAIDPGAFPDSTASDLRKRLGIDDCVVVGFVGWFDYWDRLDTLIEAFGALATSQPNVRLLLVGDGPMANDLSTQVDQLGIKNKVIMPGPVPRSEVAEYLRAMDIGVLPNSNAFGSPIALFEMMASRLAVIAPDVAPVRDVVEEGRNGFIVPNGDVDAIRESIDRLVSDEELRRRVADTARARVLEKHTWNDNGGRIADICERLLTAS